jgi:predicted AAA+ superfamily ATPase
MSLLLRFFDQNKGSYFLFGPRGTGKSTWLRQKYPDAAWIDLLDTENERRYSARPERLKDFIRTVKGQRRIIIDEIQRVPELLSLVHQQMEADKSRQFVLTGSSARKLKQSGVDLLAGRAIRRQLHPFMARELGDRFDLDQNLELGMVPLITMAEDPVQTLKGYVDLYIQQEIKTEGLIRCD